MVCLDRKVQHFVNVVVVNAIYLKSMRHPVNGSDIFRPDGSAESVLDSVGPGQNFGFVGELKK